MPGNPPFPLAPKETPMEMESLQELLVEEMRDLYSAENQLIKALPRMAKRSTWAPSGSGTR